MDIISAIPKWLIYISVTLWVASCGQKGPLYLPEGTLAEEHHRETHATVMMRNSR